jgi:hypothetical protein
VKYLKCDNVARNIDFRISAVNKASYLKVCCNTLSTCTKVADEQHGEEMSKIYSKLAEIRYIFRSPLNFGIAAGNIYGSQQRLANKEHSGQRTAYVFSLGNVVKLTSLSFVTSWQCSLSSKKYIYVFYHMFTSLKQSHSERVLLVCRFLDSRASCLSISRQRLSRSSPNCRNVEGFGAMQKASKTPRKLSISGR